MTINYIIFKGLFLFSLIGMSLLTAYLVIHPSEWIADFFEVSYFDIICCFNCLLFQFNHNSYILKLMMDGVPHSFRVLMVLLAIAHFILAFFAEVCLTHQIKTINSFTLNIMFFL
jgi:hypothetical protein